MKVLLVDDDDDLLDVTAYALRREGFNVITATDGAQALRRWENDNPAVVVLDALLPQIGGFDVCRRIREESSTPVIMLTGMTDEEHMVRGFRMGADDYVTKPFSPRMLAIRVQAVLRRTSAAAQDRFFAPVNREMRAGDLEMDVETHEVRWGERRVRLTPLEFRILHLLMINAGRVVPSARLVEYAWGYDAHDVALVRTHICHIRRKLRVKRGEPGDIVVVPSVGYRLICPEGQAEGPEDRTRLEDERHEELSSNGRPPVRLAAEGVGQVRRPSDAGMVREGLEA